MTKEDVGELPPVPTKRRAIKDALDLHIAMWLDDPTLSKRDRDRLQAEKDERKKRKRSRRLGLLVPQEGMTPEQLVALRTELGTSGATEVNHPGLSSKAHGACKSLGVPVRVHYDVRDFNDGNRQVVLESDFLLAIPKEAQPPTGPKQGLWAVIKYAKHRSVPVKVILPNGMIQET